MVSPRINPNNPSPRNYYKRNYIDAIELILPEVYKQDEITASGFETNKVDEVINTHLRIAGLMSDPTSGVAYVSSVPDTAYSSIGQLNGASQYFISQNNNTKITPQSFERDILIPVEKTLADFGSSSEFYNFLAGPTSPFLSSICNYAVSDSLTRTKAAYASTAEDTHIHLINSLSWLYFLNLSGNAAPGYGTAGYAYQPSSMVADLLVKNIYAGKTIYLEDALKLLTKFIYLNYETCGGWQDHNLLADDFLPSGVLDAGLSSNSTSGELPLRNAEAMINVIYSPQEANIQDTKVKDTFQDYIDNGTTLTSLEVKGPLHRLLKAFSYSMFDRLDEAERLNLLYDIDDCPAEYLAYIGDLIGWRLYGTDDAKKRLQLKNAVSLYKKAGTKESIQQAVNGLFAKDVFDVSSNIYELWESYIPNLIYYALATESSLFKDFTTWTATVASSKGVSVSGPSGNRVGHSLTSMDENIRYAIDHILLYLLALHPTLFILGGKNFPIQVLPGTLPASSLALSASISVGPIVPGMSIYVEDPEFVFNYRNRDFPIPPWEKVNYYSQCELTDNFIEDLGDLLVCFGVSEGFANTIKEYIKDNSLRVDDSVRDNNGWVMLTSSSNIAPNLSSLLQNPISNNLNVFGAWNSKSSHFKFIMAADSFDFSKNTFTHDSKYAPMYAAKMAKDFSPAHAIPESRLETSGLDDYVVSATPKWTINPNPIENYAGSGFALSESPLPTLGSLKSNYPVALAGAGVSAFHYGGLRRGGSNSPGYREMKRENVNKLHLINSGLIVAKVPAHENASVIAGGGIVKAPRNTFRRRNYRSLLPAKGYYDRTGFNMPISWDPSTVEFSYVGGTNGAGGVYEHLFSNTNEGSGFGFLPLGYIASAGYFAPIDDYTNLPEVYKKCEGLKSPNIFSGVVTSSTFPCRGLSSLGSNNKHSQHLNAVDNYVDREQLAEIISTMHRIQERRKLAKASYYVSSNFNNFATINSQYTPELNFANSSTESNGWFPNSIEDYHNFKFERGLHQVYDTYTKEFNRHPLSKSIYELDGPLIHGHLYGSGLFNGKFDVLGPSSVYHKTSTNPHGLSLVASSTQTVSSLTLQSLAFSGILEPGGNWTGADPTIGGGSYAVTAGLIASSVFSPSGGVVSSMEVRNRNVLSGIDFIHVSGGAPENSFTLYNISNKNAENSGNKYYIQNPLIKLKSVQGLSRLRFSLKEASGLRSYSTFYPRDDNVLTPDHKYRLSVRHAGGVEDGSFFGGVKVGTWIHTEIEDGKFWSYTTNNKWEEHNASAISEKLILNKLSHYYVSPTKAGSPPSGPKFGKPSLCAAAKEIAPSSNPSIISELGEDDYYTMHVDFHSINEGLERRELADELYGSNFISRPSKPSSNLTNRFNKSVYEWTSHPPNVHTKDQNYIIEFFMVPASENKNKYVIIDHIGLTDMTLKEKVTYDVSGDNNPLHFRTFMNAAKDTYTSEDVRVIFNFFNSLVGVNHYSPYASRVPASTAEFFGVSGGSRLSYRQQPEYYNYTRAANFNNLTSMDIVN